MTDQAAIAHLEALREDRRDEIMRRIEQRDKYSIQLIVALGALLAAALAYDSKYAILVAMAAPSVSLYFTFFIMRSYRVHDLSVSRLLEIERNLACRCGTDPELEWEHFYGKHEKSGVRSNFFVVALWLVCLGAPTYAVLSSARPASSYYAGAAMTYLVIALWITFGIRKERP